MGKLDLCLFVNGLPVATAELKNETTGQDIEFAKSQYRNDHDPDNVTLGRRAIVHFAVDTQAVAPASSASAASSCCSSAFCASTTFRSLADSPVCDECASSSFFAFTATPKGRTLELFGRLDPDTKRHEPFHLYPMRQAIEEASSSTC